MKELFRAAVHAFEAVAVLVLILGPSSLWDFDSSLLEIREN